MANAGINTARVYDIPPRWLLDMAQQCGLRIMVGLPWEQHVAFLDDRRQLYSIEQRVRCGVRTCARHPAVLCFVIGNEIPASIVRWHGHRRIERFIERLYRISKREDPLALITYVNYPSTEYLQLSFLDFICHNIYLESKDRLAAYLARLQNLAGEQPLLLAELGLDSRRHGEAQQAKSLGEQIRTAFAFGCVGTVVFAWTDEWYRGGYDIEDWDFGLNTRDRRPKPAFFSVRKAFEAVPFAAQEGWPKISVVVCSFNGASTIRDTLAGVTQLEYPDYEVILVDDGSTDGTCNIAKEYDIRIISTENQGLSSARNTGWRAAKGEYVAYIDDDAYPDPHWLMYLAATFRSTNYVGVGGPNLAPPEDGSIAQSVANAPGGPVHVLISDREAEHIPGCNMAFRRQALEAIEGFDPRYRTAGDDVDVCWRLQQKGGRLGFHPAAVVWHHRRNSIRLYWKQQLGYGKAEAMLEQKWPEKYNAAGHLSWRGRLYGTGLASALTLTPGRIYQGIWGQASFQSVYEPAPNAWSTLSLMPEWYLIVLILVGLAALGLVWQPMLYFLPVLAVAIILPVIQAAISASKASREFMSSSFNGMLGLRLLTGFLHLLQPAARLVGRLSHGLSPWRRRGSGMIAFPARRKLNFWSERWQAPEEKLQIIETGIRDQGGVVFRGGAFDAWDFQIRGGLFGSMRMLTAVEEHGAGRQLLRIRVWPRWSFVGVLQLLVFMSLAIGASFDQIWPAVIILGGLGTVLAGRTAFECAVAAGVISGALERAKGKLQ